MHVHLRTRTEVVEKIFDNVKHIYSVCRCGDRKLVRTLTLSDRRYWRTQADRSE